jgi:hypothetical protein
MEPWPDRHWSETKSRRNPLALAIGRFNLTERTWILEDVKSIAFLIFFLKLLTPYPIVQVSYPDFVSNLEITSVFLQAYSRVV